ncbi:unnamed protein product [Urochloa humidicola]
MDVALPRASNHYITAETTRLNLAPLPDGEPSKLVLDLAVTETHEWFGIGGRTGRLRRPRRLSRNKNISLPLATSAGDCRRLIIREIMHLLGKEEGFRELTTAHWDMAVPRGVEAGIAARAGAVPGGGACAYEVSIRVSFAFVYNEAEALQLACADDGDLQEAEMAPCSICLEEEMAEEGVRLPGCTHGFHWWCIGRWFEKASTCPVCRRDKLQFLPPEYMAVHDMMLSDPEGSC